MIGDTNTLTQTLVCPDGKIYFNVLNGVDVWGRTLNEAKLLIETQLANQVRNEPKVSVTLREVESKRVWLLGRVQSPGVYALHGPTTLLEGIAGAGGTLSLIGQRDIPLSTAVDELADLPRSFVIRKGQLLPVDFDRLMNRGDLSQNIYLEPDDFVYLPPATAKDVYVIGAVAQPRSVSYTDTLTLAGAIASCYGTIHDAYVSHTAIVRGSLSNPEITIVNFNDVQRGRARDVALQPHDIIYVPYSPYRYVEKYAQIILNTFAASVAINAGSTIVLKRPAQPAGIFIPVGSRISVIPPLPPVN
jgi:protein involved in polysaccharide export with SLBB domain